MKLCDHIEYTLENKTLETSATINVNNQNVATCNDCNTEVDISFLREGGWNIIRKNQISNYAMVNKIN